MTIVRVSPALSAKIQDEALRGKNPLFSMSSRTELTGDSLSLLLVSTASESAHHRLNVATSRMRPAQHSPVTTWRPTSGHASPP